jgi:Zn-dependent M28 family amino/carboxypeptidase
MKDAQFCHSSYLYGRCRSLLYSREIWFSFFDLEEEGSIGSGHIADYVAATNKKALDLMISLEMIGYFTDKPNSQNYPAGLL